jgi:hypothetical protein
MKLFDTDSIFDDKASSFIRSCMLVHSYMLEA